MVPRLQAAVAFVFCGVLLRRLPLEAVTCASRYAEQIEPSRVHDPFRQRTQTSPRAWWRNRMRYFLSAVMAAGWFCIAMAAFAQSTRAPPAPVAPASSLSVAEGVEPSSNPFMAR